MTIPIDGDLLFLLVFSMFAGAAAVGMPVFLCFLLILLGFSGLFPALAMFVIYSAMCHQRRRAECQC